MTPRYLVGIDLGTSNSALSYVDTRESSPEPHLLAVTQRGEGQTEFESTLLRSMLYLPHPEEQNLSALSFSPDVAALPVVGQRALLQQSRTPGRVIASAKSWLVHSGVDRLSPILPWGSEDLAPEEKLSPVTANSRILSYFRLYWNAVFARDNPENALERQQLTVTVPASFDEAAQRLTKEAILQAGLPESTVLLEEPQAAFLWWLHRVDRPRTAQNRDAASGARTVFDELAAEHTHRSSDDPLRILVCDIGGGTTDFSLFDVTFSNGRAEYSRSEVSDHILLGGDNLDLALAHRLEESAGRKLSTKQWHALVAEARRLKEEVLQGNVADASGLIYTVALAGEGSGLFASTLTLQISSDELCRTVLEGFFPHCEGNDRPQRPKAGLRELGLPYPADTAITRHLAAFLRGRTVDAVLYTGGTLIPEFLRSRLTDEIRGWQGGAPIRVLETHDLEHGVALGAALYSWERSRTRYSIRSGYPRSLYVEVGHRDVKRVRKGICVLEKGSQPNTAHAVPDQRFSLLVGKPVRFQLFYSNHRPDDRLGALVDLDENDFRPLPPLHTVVRDDESSRVREETREVSVESRVNELNLFSLICRDTSSAKEYALEFNLRSHSAPAEDTGDTIETARREKLHAAVRKYFGKGGGDDSGNVKHLFRELEQLIGPRSEWSLAELRTLWDPLEKGMGKRSRSPEHESQWLRLAGFVLRPGFGAPLDEWRIDQLWRLLSQGLAFPKVSQNLTEWWILWRRVAGGLSAQRQSQLYQAVRRDQKGPLHPELLRLLASLERLGSEKRSLALEVSALATGKTPLRVTAAWALTRLLSRVPLYAESSFLLPSTAVQEIVAPLLELPLREERLQPVLPAISAGCRIVGVREIEVSEEFRRKALFALRAAGARGEITAPLEQRTELTLADKIALFGEALPSGLRID